MTRKPNQVLRHVIATALNAAGAAAPAVSDEPVDALCFELGGPAPAETADWRVLIPAPEGDGIIKGIDGRWWRIPNPAAVVAAFTKPIPIDISHATELRVPRGEDAPAVGWVEELRANDDGSISGRIEWTERGAWLIKNKEYRFGSPVFAYVRDTKEIVRIKSIGLVNEPNFNIALNSAQNRRSEEEPMNWKQLLALLGLADNATEEQAMNAVKKLQGDLATATNNAQHPSLDKYVPRADFDNVQTALNSANEKLKNIEQTTQNEKIETAINAALAAGKITPSTVEYHKAQCAMEGGLERFENFVEKAPVIADPSDLDTRKPSGGKDTALNAEQQHIAAMFGNTAEDIAKYGNA